MDMFPALGLATPRPLTLRGLHTECMTKPRARTGAMILGGRV